MVREIHNLVLCHAKSIISYRETLCCFISYYSYVKAKILSLGAFLNINTQNEENNFNSIIGIGFKSS